MRLPTASSLTLALLLGSALPAQGALINSLRDGIWYCNFPSSTCSFDAAVPGASDIVRINHNVTYWGQGADPTPPVLTQIEGLQLAAGGFLGIYDGRALWVTGTSSFEGGRMDGAINGGGTFENRGTLNVSAASGLSINGSVATNRGLWRVLPGARFEVSLGGSSFFTNSQGAGGTAVLELQGGSTTVMSNQGPLLNQGIVRKTGAAMAIFQGALVNVVDGVDGGTIHIAEGELLFNLPPPPLSIPGQIEARDGIRLVIASGAQLRIADGGRYLMSTTSGGTAIHDLSGGGKLVLGAGGMLSANGPGVYSLDYDPGEFELRGGTLAGGQVRNDGTLTVAGGGTPLITGPFSNFGNIVIGAGNTLQLSTGILNQSSGSFELQDGAALTGAALQNAGLVIKRGGSGTATIEATNNTASGMLIAQTGVLERREGGDQFIGTIWAMHGATFRRADANGNPAGVWCFGCTLQGAGTFAASNLLHQGLIEPGDQEIGQLQMTGTLQMQAESVLRFEIGGSQPAQSDRLVVPAFVANNSTGTLIARFIDGFDPRAGQRFALIQTNTPPLLLPNLQFEGLQPGFSAHLEVNGGFIEVVADSNGINLDTVFRNGFEDP